MKFQWYVIDLDMGSVTGSNDVDEIRHHLTDDTKVVMTAQHGKYYHGSTVERQVEPEVKEDSLGDNNDDEEEGD